MREKRRERTHARARWRQQCCGCVCMGGREGGIFVAATSLCSRTLWCRSVCGDVPTRSPNHVNPSRRCLVSLTNAMPTDCTTALCIALLHDGQIMAVSKSPLRSYVLPSCSPPFHTSQTTAGSVPLSAAFQQRCDEPSVRTAPTMEPKPFFFCVAIVLPSRRSRARARPRSSP